MNREESVEERQARPLLQVVQPPLPERRRLGPLPYILVLLPGLLLALSAIVEDYLWSQSVEERGIDIEEDIDAGTMPGDELVAGGEDDVAPRPDDLDATSTAPVLSPVSHNGIVDAGP